MSSKRGSETENKDFHASKQNTHTHTMEKPNHTTGTGLGGWGWWLPGLFSTAQKHCGITCLYKAPSREGDEQFTSDETQGYDRWGYTDV